MSKRTKFALLVLFALLLLLLGLYFILSPFFQKPSAPVGGEYAVPGVLPPTKTAVSPDASRPSATGLAGDGAAATGTETRQPSAGERLRGLEYQARAAVERLGSGTSQNGFLGYADLMTEGTERFKAELLRLQQEMQAAHPLKGPVFGVSTRAASSHIKDGQFGDDALTAEVQAVQTYDAGNPRQPTGTAAKRFSVTFAKQADGGYLIDGLKWEDMEL